MNLKSIIAAITTAAAGAASVYCLYKRKKHSKNKLLEENITFSRMARALAKDYVSIYYVNTIDNSYIEFAAKNGKEKLTVLTRGDDFFADTVLNAKRLVHEEDQKMFITALRKKNILSSIKNDTAFTLCYRLVIDNHPVYYALKSIQGFGQDDKYIVIGVRNIDTQTRRQRAAEAEKLKYSQIISAIAKQYQIIYYVDTVTDKYNEYTSNKSYARLKSGSHGDNFFDDCLRNAKNDVYPDDYEMISREFDKETFLKNIAKKENFSLSYRLMIKGKPEYVNLVAMRSADDRSHVIIAVKNVDSLVRKEEELKKSLGSAITIANIDALTGVKNKYAYNNLESEINKLIDNGNPPDFAVVVFDINGLKAVNDNQGHAAGDEFIRSACMAICTIYKHSPVFRIGGDEFAAILRGSDFECRESLCLTTENIVEQNKEKGLVTFAFGMAVYDPDYDKNFADVFGRADSKMYSNKRKFKFKAKTA